ncbi:hypothetical protein GE061_008669 [Apolygus lucorum]|uniref:C2H2-type domain-containing protein n=1 Tax=Apolygus lucorum TaxID=248454 RepID=A0A8S9WLI1_APOLU|nr:hypothetical protein GE061_008669 [Apolygus lucorum]
MEDVQQNGKDTEVSGIEDRINPVRIDEVFIVKQEVIEEEAVSEDPLHISAQSTHTSPARPKSELSCDICGYQAANKRERNRHRKVHLGNKPFVCDECGFKARSRYDVHPSHRCLYIAWNRLELKYYDYEIMVLD